MRIDQYSEISTGTVSANQQALQNLNSNKAKQTSENAAASGFALNIGEMTNVVGPYSDKQEQDDLIGALEATDVQLKQDYLSVMSLSASDEDMAEMARTGQAPEDMDATDAVTIIDDIKAALIRGGAEITGYTDDMDAATLEQITGSAAAARRLLDEMHTQDVPVNEDTVRMITDAAKRAGEVLPLSEQAAANLISSRQAPTVENIYHASHAGTRSGAGAGYYNEDGYLNRTAVSADMDQLRPQIEDTIRRSGLEINETTMKEAEWLLDRNLPLTPETLLELERLNTLSVDIDPEAVTRSVAIAIGAGIPADHANLTYDTSIYTQAEELDETIKSIPDEASDLVTDKGQILNIRNLRMAAAQLADQAAQTDDTASAAAGYRAVTAAVAPDASADTAGTVDLSGLSADQIHNRRILEEARLSMTVEAGRMLIRFNYRYETAPLEELVDTLKSAEAAFAQRLFPADDGAVSEAKAGQYRDTRDALQDIYAAPAAILGMYRSSTTLRFGDGETFTLNEVHTTGISVREDYIRAGAGYEALMTAPRADMGDSIRKAFANVDDILRDLGMDTDDLNARAVRILGYNSMEITEAAIEQVRAADVNLRSVLARLTPDRVIQMIREDVNPLNMPIQELGDYLDSRDREPEQKAADYARFLMQLERHNEITELERDSYIGIYRMISSLDRTEDAALGRLMAMGSEISFSTLLSAMRSTARSGMDVTVDDAFGGMDPVRLGAAIDAQIDAAFSGTDTLSRTPIAETVIENLLMSGNEVSLSNVEAMNLIKGRRGNWARPVDRVAPGESTASAAMDRAESTETASTINERTDNALEQMIDRAAALDSYLAMMDAYRSDLSEAALATSDLIDIRSIRGAMKQINILTAMARDEVYDLPVEFDGELTSIRLTMRHEAGAGRVAVTLSAQSVGNIAAEFTMSGQMSGYVAYETPEAGERLSAQTDALISSLGFAPELVHSTSVDPDRYTDRFLTDEKSKKEIKKDAGSSDIDNIELYRVAKDFISIIRAM